jgi:hypothetical protein
MDAFVESEHWLHQSDYGVGVTPDDVTKVPAKGPSQAGHGMTEDISYTHRFVANSDTGKRFARAILGRTHRMKRQWIAFSLVLVIFTLMLSSGLPWSVSLGSRIVWAAGFALVPTIIFAVLNTAMRYVQMVRTSKVRLYNGAILETGFGEEEMVVRTPTSSGRMAYRGMKSVTARGDFVFLKHHGLSIVAAYPRELFPDEAIDRILRFQRGDGRVSK